jgi:lipoprotein-releasing system ATP-binding protein
MSSPPRIAATGLGKAYGTLKVLGDLELTVPIGEVVAILGTSGSGKSTLLHCLGLLDRPDTGTLLLDGRDVGTLGQAERTRLRASHIGFVFQAFNLLSEFSVVENVLMSARAAGLDLGAARARAHDLLTVVGLETRHASRIATLSGGERQRIALCRALITRPHLLLADEPTGNLDPTTASVVLTQLIDLARRDSSSVIIVTHDAAVAERCDRRLELRDGRLRTASQ